MENQEQFEFNITNNNNNNDSFVNDCIPHEVPSIQTYIKGTDTYGVALICIGSSALILSIFLFIDTIQYIIQNSSARVKAHTVYVLAVYPITCFVSYISIIIPRAYLISEALTQGIFMSGMYQLFHVFISYCGGQNQLIRKKNLEKLTLQVGPCCCWPCCYILPKFDVNCKTINRLKMLVLQLPLVQSFAYIIQLVMWSEAEHIYRLNYLYLQPFIIASILLGVWGMSMTMKMIVSVVHSEFCIIKKFITLQLVLVFSKLQGFAVKAFMWTDTLPCNPPITPHTYVILIQNSLLIVEMIILGFIARNLYKRNIDKQDNFIAKISNNIPKTIDPRILSNSDKSYDNMACDVVVYY